jgi:UPF0271 protein
MLSVDLNCDLGEGFPHDRELMTYISSANIACGFHAGDMETMRQTVEMALEHDVAIGAHPSYPDRKNFGRIDLIDSQLRAEDLPMIISEQINRLQTICSEFGTKLHHVKPHGALYNRAAWDEGVCSFICTAIEEIDSFLLFYGLSGSEMKIQSVAHHLGFVNEVFADRTYSKDGSLTPRQDPIAVIKDNAIAVGQVLQMLQQGTVTSTAGKRIPITAETICIHGDEANAPGFAKAVHDALMKNGIKIEKPSGGLRMNN